jgi:CRISPR/Cas system type I-B associated protein Csh2 (Cas7 group RAMP superfamily)
MIPIATLDALLREGALSKEAYDRLVASSIASRRRRRGEIEADLLDLGASPEDVQRLYEVCERLTNQLRGSVRPSNGRAIHSVRVWILHEDALADRAEAAEATTAPAQAQATAADPAQATAADPAQAEAAKARAKKKK